MRKNYEYEIKEDEEEINNRNNKRKFNISMSFTYWQNIFLLSKFEKNHLLI